METDILFSDNVDSTAMIPAVQAAIALAEMQNTAPLMPMSQYLSSITTVRTTSGIDDRGNSIDGGKAHR